MAPTQKPITIGNLTESGNEIKPERRDAAANRALILETAERLFNERGVVNVNMADIAQAAGVGKGTLYRRFAHKGELCLALMDTQMAEFQERMLTRMRQMAAQGACYMDQLDEFLDSLVYFTDIHHPLLCEVQREGFFMGNADLTLPHFWQYMTVNGLLQRAANAGEIASDLDIAYIADAILAPLKVDMFRFQRESRGFSLARISTGLRSFVTGLRCYTK